MSEIDWSKAPEGFPLWLKDLKPSTTLDQSGWHRDDGDRYTDLHDRHWLKKDGGEYSVFERPSPAWSGDGLPPVGVDLQWFSSVYGWIGGKVVAHDEQTTIVRHNDGYEGCYLHNLKPCKTPEQIAADERKAGILEMIDVFGLDTSIWGLMQLGKFAHFFTTQATANPNAQAR